MGSGVRGKREIYQTGNPFCSENHCYHWPAVKPSKDKKIYNLLPLLQSSSIWIQPQENSESRVRPQLTLHGLGKKKKTIFANPANNTLLLQHSASGHAASAAPSALERLQGGKRSWECNKLRIQYNHDCSVLRAYLKPHVPSSCFLFSDTYFVKLLFLMHPPLSRCLRYLFLSKCWFHMPFQCVTFSLNSQGTASWVTA